MPNLFGDVQFAKYTPTYVGAPIEQFAKTAEVLNQRWEQNKEMKDQFDIAASNIKLEDADNPILKARLAKIREAFAGTLERNDFENAGTTIRTQFKEFAMDGALKAAQENYAIRQGIKDELRKKYDKTEISATQYQKRIKEFNQYSGIGTPDELGFYDKYSFDFGPNKVDLDKFAYEALRGYNPDTITSSGSSFNYGSPEERAAGIRLSQSSSAVKVSNGTRGKVILEEQMKNNPDLMAYVQDEVNIHNENNPDKLITAKSFIEDYANDYVARYMHKDISSSTEQLNDRNEFLKGLASQGNGSNSGEFSGVFDVPLKNEDVYDGAGALSIAKNNIIQERNSNLLKNNPNADINMWYPSTGALDAGRLFSKWLNKPTKADEDQYKNLKNTGLNDAQIVDYITNSKKTGLINRGLQYSPSASKIHTEDLLIYMGDRKVRDQESGELMDGAKFDKTILSKKGTKLTAIGEFSNNNTYADASGEKAFVKSYLVKVTNDTDETSKQYIVSAKSSEVESPEFIRHTVYNRLTQTIRSKGAPAIVAVPGNEAKPYNVQQVVRNGKITLDIRDYKTGNLINTIPYTYVNSQGETVPYQEDELLNIFGEAITKK